MPTETNQNFAHWAIIQVFGHEQYAGHVTTEQIGGTSMIKLTVPDVEGEFPLPGFTKYINISSVFDITPVAEEYAKAMVRRLKKHPVTGYEHQQIISKMAEKAFEELKYAEVKKLVEREKELASLEE